MRINDATASSPSDQSGAPGSKLELIGSAALFYVSTHWGKRRRRTSW